jgi:hypothetical protein
LRHDAFPRDVPVNDFFAAVFAFAGAGVSSFRIDSLFNPIESSESCGKDAGIELLSLLKYDYSIV